MKLSFYGIYRVFIVHDIHKRKRVFKICTLFTICFLCPKCNIQCIYVWYFVMYKGDEILVISTLFAARTKGCAI